MQLFVATTCPALPIVRRDSQSNALTASSRRTHAVFVSPKRQLSFWNFAHSNHALNFAPSNDARSNRLQIASCHSRMPISDQ